MKHSPHADCIEYAVSILLRDDPKREETARHIFYGPEKVPPPFQQGLHIAASGFFDHVSGDSTSLPSCPPAEIDGIPFLYGSPRIQRSGNILLIHADIIASTFFLITRYEEIIRRDIRDSHGRFPGQDSVPARFGFIGRPVIEQYSSLLYAWLQTVGIAAEQNPPPFRICLTHDVDHIRKYRSPLRVVANTLLTGQNKRDALHATCAAAGLHRDPFDTFEGIQTMENGLRNTTPFDVQTIYFFMSEDRHNQHYSLKEKTVQQLIHRLHDQGADIGLHISYEAGENPSLIRAEKEKLQEVCGFEIQHSRHHFLRLREPEHARFLAQAGIRHDYTLGYADRAGFRCGTCRPFNVMNLHALQPLELIAHPLQIMDQTLSDARYMNLSCERALIQSREIITQCRRHHGELVLLWHNSSLGRQNEFHHSLYTQILDDLKHAYRT